MSTTKATTKAERAALKQRVMRLVKDLLSSDSFTVSWDCLIVEVDSDGIWQKFAPGPLFSMTIRADGETVTVTGRKL